MPKPLVALFDWFWARAWLLLALTAALWGANGVASRLAVGAISPMALVFARWFVVVLVLGFVMRKALAEHAETLRANWKQITLMGTLGFTAFTALFYASAYYTTAVNITLLQSSIPPLVLAGAALFKDTRTTPMQLLGMAVTLIGVALIATQGDLGKLTTLSFNRGDVMILIACLLYAGYTVALRDRPALPALVFFCGLALAAFVTSIPLFVAELAIGQAYWPSVRGWALLVFIAFGPSLVSQLFFMRGVELLGPGRAGLISNLVPIFGALFAVAILNEPFHLYHAIAMALGLGGIWIAEHGAGKS